MFTTYVQKMYIYSKIEKDSFFFVKLLPFQVSVLLFTDGRFLKMKKH